MHTIKETSMLATNLDLLLEDMDPQIIRLSTKQLVSGVVYYLYVGHIKVVPT
jgi:hypothetical protein